MAYYAHPHGDTGLVLLTSKPVDIQSGKVEYVWDALFAPFSCTLLRAELVTEVCVVSATIYVQLFNVSTGNVVTTILPGPVADDSLTVDDIFVGPDTDIGHPITVMDKLRFQYTSDAASYATNVMMRLWLHPND